MKIFYKILLLVLMTSCISRSKVGMENERCFDDGTCIGDLICNEEFICVKPENITDAISNTDVYFDSGDAAIEYCESNIDCINTDRPYCDIEKNVCVQCRKNDDCNEDMICSNNRCVLNIGDGGVDIVDIMDVSEYWGDIEDVVDDGLEASEVDGGDVESYDGIWDVGIDIGYCDVGAKRLYKCQDGRNIVECICENGGCKPRCEQTGTKSEGWYDCKGELIRFSVCEGCEVSCLFWGEEKEGWYSDCEGLISSDRCAPEWKCVEDPEKVCRESNVFCKSTPSAFELETPANGVDKVWIRPLFNWQDSTDPDSGDSVTYRIQVDNDSDFSSPAIDRSGLTVSEYQVLESEALAFDTQYHWRVIASDQCPTEVASAIFQFRTARPEVCNNSPSAPVLELPADGATGVSTTPTFNWSDSTDPDVGDSVTYRLIVSANPDLSSPVLDRSGLTVSEYTVSSSEALAEGVTYYWKVIATDTCGQTTESSGIRTFTTLPPCTPRTITETNFTDGTRSNTDITTLPGTLILDRPWTVRWHANEGVLPNFDTPAWTYDAPAGGITELVTDPVTGEPAVHIDSTSVNEVLRFVRSSLGLSNATGSAFQIRARIVRDLGPDGFGCAVELSDDSRNLRLGMDESKILETFTLRNFIMDTTTSSHTYRLGLRGGNFAVYADESFAFDQGGGTIGFNNLNWIRWGDQSAGVGIACEMYVNHFYYYTAGNLVPFLTPGTYESVIYDLTTSSSNLGSGATISYAGTTPASTSIVFETRSGNTATPDGSWSSWVGLGVGDTIQSPAARYLQVRIRLNTGDLTVSPQLENYTVNYCTY